MWVTSIRERSGWFGSSKSKISRVQRWRRTIESGCGGAWRTRPACFSCDPGYSTLSAVTAFLSAHLAGLGLRGARGVRSGRARGARTRTARGVGVRRGERRLLSRTMIRRPMIVELLRTYCVFEVFQLFVPYDLGSAVVDLSEIIYTVDQVLLFILYFEECCNLVERFIFCLRNLFVGENPKYGQEHTKGQERVIF